MKILYLSHRIPFPPNKGDKIRSFNQVKHLAVRHQVDLICLADDQKDVKYGDDLRKLCRRVHVQPIRPLPARAKGLCSLLQGSSISVGYFYRRAVQERVDQWLSEASYDAIVCFSSTMAEYVFRSRVPHSEGRPQLIMDFCDVDSDKWGQYAKAASGLKRSLYHLEQKRVQAYECRVNRFFDHSLLITSQEARLFRCFDPDAKSLQVIGNGVDTVFFSGSSTEPADKPGHLQMIFTGAMDYQANIDAVQWFTSEMLPGIRVEIGQAQFCIVGSRPTAEVQKLSNQTGVCVTGFVEDIRPWYQQSQVAVLPLRLARGLQNKVLEAMAMQKAVVTTSKVAEAIQAVDGEHLLIADSAEEFVTAVLRLYRDPALRHTMGEQARRFVAENFSWTQVMAKFESLLSRHAATESVPGDEVDISCGAIKRPLEVI